MPNYKRYPDPPQTHDASNPTVPIRSAPMYEPTEIHDASDPPKPATAKPRPTPPAKGKR